MTGWQPELCATCGHARGDHKDSGAGWPHKLTFGICLVGVSPLDSRERCPCQEFVSVEDDDEQKAAA